MPAKLKSKSRRTRIGRNRRNNGSTTVVARVNCWIVPKMFHILGIPIFSLTMVCFTLVTLDQKFDHLGYQLFFPVGGFVFHYGLHTRNLNTMLIGFYNVLISFLIESHISYTINKKFMRWPFNKIVVGEQLGKSLETIYNCDKTVLIILVLRPILLFYLLWFLTEVDRLQNRRSHNNSMRNDCLAKKYSEQQKHSTFHELSRSIFPGHPIIHSLRYYNTIVLTSSTILMLSYVYVALKFQNVKFVPNT